MNVRLLLLLAALTPAGCASTSVRGAAPSAPAAIADRSVLADIPHERVDFWIGRFSSGDKHAEFASYLARMPQYEEMIRAKLRRRGMPEDLLFLAMIESGFNADATSRDGAAGIWQLLPGTARQWGLRVDETIDERRDPEKSTDAALSLLSHLYNRFGSWYLAASAYNTGENRLAAIMTEVTGRESGSDADFYRIIDRLTGETRDFVPVMMAARRIARDPTRYGF